MKNKIKYKNFIKKILKEKKEIYEEEMKNGCKNIQQVHEVNENTKSS